MTLADIEADLLTYTDYKRLGSISRAQLFVERADQWLILKAESASHQSSSMSINKQHVENMRNAAEAFIAANSSTGDVRFLQPGGFFR